MAASLSALLVIALGAASFAAARPLPRLKTLKARTENESAPVSYRIHLKLDFDGRTYTGTERVRWTNLDDDSTSVLYFHLYSNSRTESEQRGTPTAAVSGESENKTVVADEPRLEILGVRSAEGAAIPYALDAQATILRVSLREPVATGEGVEVEIKFRGSVPEIDAEETTLGVHVLQQVGAALRGERETRRARDLNFRCRGVMLLGTAYPVLAARDGGDWQRKVELSVGDFVFAEAADYLVSIETPTEVALFTSGESAGPEKTAADASGANAETNGHVREFAGKDLRDFAIVAGRSLRLEERHVGDLTVRSVFMPEHERVARRVLSIAADAARVYLERFGPLPYKTVNIADVPLVAGLGSAEFAGLGGIASAFYVDFDSPSLRNLPEIVREQRASLEDSLEFMVAHVVAHQWWGAVVGNDPARNPFLDEALSNWSALLYYQDVHGPERAEVALNEQLRGVYKIYRTFGGQDMEATRPARDYRNAFQYTAIVACKGALMFRALRQLIGDEGFFAALKNYYKSNMFEVVEPDEMRDIFLAQSQPSQRRAVVRLFNRWLSSKRGDEDIAPPDPKLAAAFGLNPNAGKRGDRNAFARLGKFFWQQMTRIR
jgi:hypothetical protein